MNSADLEKRQELEISLKSPATVQSRLDLIDKVVTSLLDEKEALMKASKYCPVCLQCHFTQDCHVETKNFIESICTNPLTGGYLDPYEYEEVKVLKGCYVCPNGHQITEWKEYWWRDD